MKLALLSLAVASVIARWGPAQAPADDPAVSRQQPSPVANPAAGDAWVTALSEELASARAARAAKDHVQSRETIARAIDRAMAELGAREDERSLGLLAELATFAYEAGDLTRSGTARHRVFEIRRGTLPADHPDLLMSRMALAISISSLGDPRGSLEHFEAVLAGRVRTLPAEHRDVLNARKNLAVTLERLGEFEAARALQQEVLEALLRQFPDDHAEVLKVRHNLAMTLFSLGDLEGARGLFQRVLDVRTRTLADDDQSLQSTRTALAAALSKLGETRAALALQTKVVEVLSVSLPEGHPDLMGALGNLALTKRELGDLRGSRALEERVLAARARSLPDDHADLQAARGNLALSLRMLGDLSEARALEEKVLEIRARTLPDDHPELQIARQNLALTLKLVGDLRRARALEERVLEVRARTLPDDHPYLAEARMNLAITLQDLGDPAAARALQEKVLEVQMRTFPEEHPNVLKSRQNLAATLRELGELDRAWALEQEVLEARSRFLPEAHPDLLGARQNLAQSMAAMGELAAARKIEESVLEIRARTLPADHPELHLARRDLATTILAGIALARAGHADPGASTSTAEDVARLTDLARDLCRAQTGAARTIVLSAPSREAEERCERLARSLDFALSLALGSGVVEPLRALEPEAFAFAETARGAALASAALTRKTPESPRYQESLAKLQRASAELAALAQRGAPSDEFDRAREARDAAEGALVDLARQLPGGGVRSWSLAADSLAASLREGQAAVGFRRFDMWRSEVREAPAVDGRPSVVETAEGNLCAFVVRPAGPAKSGRAALELVDLGPIAPIERAVQSWRDGLAVARGASGRGISAGAGVLAGDLRARGHAVRRLVFDPLARALGSSQHLVLVLDDVLHLVPFDALPIDEKGFDLLGDRRRIETRATLAELLSTRPVAGERDVMVAFGGATFDATPIAADAEEDAPTEASAAPETQVAALLRGGAWESGFTPLPETGREARELAELHDRVAGEDAESLAIEGRRASRESLFELAPRARWLHVATHGWFAPEPIPSWSDPEPLDVKTGLGVRMSSGERVRGMSPMLMCGLALAGANLPENELGRAPGLVTAEEIAALDLSRCELAVLSACDTNVGERRAGQGVASLQKALQMAGARSVITSLWKVPDEATRELMVDFYRRLWVEKKPKWQALWEAKRKLRDAKDERGQPLYTTRDWAAWVLTGDPR